MSREVARFLCEDTLTFSGQLSNVSRVTSKGIPWQVSVARSYKATMET